jgi:hypothetical protein
MKEPATRQATAQCPEGQIMSSTKAANPNSAFAASAADKRVLGRIFQHPLSHNLSWRECLAMLEAIGTVEHAHNGDVVVRLGREQQSFRPERDKDMPPEDVMVLRHFLSRAGWAPGSVPAAGAALIAQDLVVVIDHAGARVYPATSDDGRVPHELHHLLHQIDRADHDADREETWPVDTRYFDAVAAAVAGSGRIVVVGHGKGQSNEADHLMAYFFKHHSAVHARIAREIVADLPHLTVPQLLALARHALQPAQDTAVPRAG